MSHFLDTLDTGCASLETFPRTSEYLAGLREPGWEERDLEREKIHETIAYMTEHLTEHMQVRRLAALINVSPSYYFALFKRQTGYAPIDFLIHLRMRRACRLLAASKLSVKEI